MENFHQRFWTRFLAPTVPSDHHAPQSEGKEKLSTESRNDQKHLKLEESCHPFDLLQFLALCGLWRCKEFDYFTTMQW